MTAKTTYTHTLPTGTVATRTSHNAYTHVVVVTENGTESVWRWSRSQAGAEGGVREFARRGFSARVALIGDETPATPAAEDTTKAYRIGKLLRAFVLEHSGADDLRVSSALVAHIASRNVCYDGTATLRLTPAWAEELINAASEMDAEAKAAARAARRTLYTLFA